MRTQFATFLVALLCIAGSLHAQWISFEKGVNLKQQPDVKLISSNEHAAIIEIKLHGVLIEQLATKEGNCQTASLLNNLAFNEVGKPSIPYVAKILAIPDDASVSYEIIEMGDVEIIDNVKLVAGRGSWLERDPEPEYKSYEGKASFPENLVFISEPSVFRDFRICRVSIFPVQYNAVKKQLKVAKKLKVKIEFGKGEAINVKTTPKRNIAPSFAAIYKHTIFNYDEVVEQYYKDREEAPEVLLIIAPDDYYEHIQGFIQWKRQAGFDVLVTKFSDINANNVNPDVIRDYIADVYNTAENPPTYVTLIGDDGVFPHKIVVYSDYSFPDEDYFVKVDGDDFVPDIFVGRLPAQSPGELNVMTNKIIQYEKNPFLDDPSWFKKGLCCSNNRFESQVLTKEFTADIMLIDGGFTLVNEYMADGTVGDCTYSTEDVIAALNDGRSFLNYRGEGWVEGWYPNCTPFFVEDLQLIENGRMHPFITSIGCGVAQFVAAGGDCFGERWLKMGSISNPSGAINFIGPVSNTHTAENNTLDEGIYIGVFQEGLTTPGQALLRGKMNVYYEFGPDAYETEYQFNVYTDLGDPTTKIWKDIPFEITVTHSDSITSDSSTITIWVDSLLNGEPVNNATVSIVGSNLHVSGKTDMQGKITFDNEFITNEILTVTVTGNNIKTYTGSIEYTNSNGIEDAQSGNNYLIASSPNPFYDYTTIDYSLNEAADIKLLVYDISGRLIRSLYHGHRNRENYQVNWDGFDDKGTVVSSGVYFVSLQSNSTNNTIRVVKL